MPIALDFKPKGFRLKSIFSIFPFSVRDADDEKEDKIRVFIFKAQELEEKMAEIRIRLERRSEELFRKVVAALRQGEKKKAEVYAAEIVHLKKLLKLIRAIELLAVKSIERAKTVNDARELGEMLLAFAAALDEVREQMKGLYPSLAIMYGEVAKNVKMMLLETMPPDVTDIDIEAVSQEASRMLEEVMREAEKEIERRLPSESIEKILGEKSKVLTKTGVLPASRSGESSGSKERVERGESKARKTEATSTQKSASSGNVAVAVPTAHSSSVSAGARASTAQAAVKAASVKRSRLSQEELERILLDYILVHGGFLDLSDFTRRYGVSKEEVLAALQRLHAKGLIRLA